MDNINSQLDKPIHKSILIFIYITNLVPLKYKLWNHIHWPVKIRLLIIIVHRDKNEEIFTNLAPWQSFVVYSKVLENMNLLWQKEKKTISKN